ncbi:MAG: hypothetical protein HGA19_07310 [Oscillochloris sp.]|nr:hypothetical protein [Oscillochloris sp.]
MLSQRLPDLYCPFPSAINPHTTAANEQALAWAQQWSLSSNSSTYHQLAKLDLGKLAGLTHPTASAQSLQLIADWCTWLFLHDDFCDEAALSNQPIELAKWHDDLIAIIDSRHSGVTDQGMIAGFANLWQRSIVNAPYGWVERFGANLKQFFAAHIWEAYNRAYHLPLDLEAYLVWRPLTSGMYMYIDLIEVVHHLTLPPEILLHPLVRQLRTFTARGACWVNDIISFEKEVQRGEPHNLVAILATTQHVSYSEALVRAGAIHDQEVYSFINHEQCLLAQPHLLSPDVQHYIAVLQSYLRGNLDWTSQSIRYNSVQAMQKAVGGTI